MRTHRIASSIGGVLLCCCLLAACGSDQSAADSAQGDDGLPKPAAAGRSVTGMPDPGVASARPARVSEEPATDAIELPEGAVDGETAPADDAIEPVPADAPAAPEPPEPHQPDAPPANDAGAIEPGG